MLTKQFSFIQDVPVTVDSLQHEREIVFVDTSVSGWQKLTQSFSKNMEVVYLNKQQDAIIQMANVLTGKTELSAIHIVSHGEKGQLNFGNMSLNSGNLEAYKHELAAIGQALSDKGDIMLYGCDVAEHEGQKFIESLSSITGADVSASTNKTGDASRGGDWVLEANVGAIETKAIVLSDYSGLLSSYSTTLQFSQKDISVGGGAFTKDLLHISNLDFTDVSLGLSNAFGSLYTKASLDTDFKLSLNMDFLSSKADIEYPVYVNVQTSDVVKTGSMAIVDTSNFSVSSAVLNAVFTQVANVELLLDAMFDPKLKGLYLDTLFTSEHAITERPLMDPTPYNSRTTLFKASATTSGFELSSDLLEESISVDELSAEIDPFKAIPALEGLFNLGFSAPGDIEASGSYSGSGLNSMTATGVSQNSLISGEFNVTELIGKKFPLKFESGFTSSGEKVEYDDENAKYGISAKLLELIVGLGEKLTKTFTFIPGDVLVDLTNRTTGESKSGILGDIFTFTAPSSGKGQMEIDAEYTMTGKIVSQFGLVTDLYFKWDALSASMKFGDTEFEINLSDQIMQLLGVDIPKDVSLAQFGAIPIGNKSESSVDNLGRFTDTYTISYDEEYEGTGSTNIHYNNEGTIFDDYLFGSDGDDVMRGYAGNDKIMANYGHDTVSAGDGDDYVKGGLGNDTIYGGDGADTIYGGKGDDIIYEGGDSSYNEIYGEGDDTITLVAGDNGYYSAKVYGGEGRDKIVLDFSRADSGLKYYSYNPNYHHSYHYLYNSASFADVRRFSLISETIQYEASGAILTDNQIEDQIIKGSAHDDLFIHKTGYTSVFDGQAGNDTLYADLSASTEAITAKAGKVTNASGTIITATNIERLLLSTGSGNDVIDNSANNADDNISTGAGNDTINAGQGNDTIDAGAGNDTITLSTLGSTTSRISGGAGIDTLNLDYSATEHYSGLAHVFYYKNDENQSTSDNVYANSDKESIATLLAKKSLYEHEYVKHHAFSSANHIYDDLTIENQNIKGTQADDLFIHKTGYTSVFDGQAGNDTLYADLSLSTDAITAKAGNITNTSGTLTATNIERLLLSTGSGNDVIDNSVNNTNDDISTGAGNDTINAGQGNDTIDAGAGNDTITLSTLGSTASRISGGAGIDTLKLDYSATEHYSGLAHVFYYKNDENQSTSDNVYANSDRESIATLLAKKSLYEHEYVKHHAFSSANHIYDDLTIENQNIKGTQADDLFIHKTGYTSVFDGQAGNDTLYADLSSSTDAITAKAGNITNTSGTLTATNIERLLLSTGSGNDVIDNSANNADDDISTGAGNDTITLSTLGYTTSRISGGAGIDTLNLDYSATKESSGIQHTFHYKDTNGYTSSYGSYGSSVSKENIQKALTDKRVFEHHYYNHHVVNNGGRSNYIHDDLTIENQNIKGTQADDLFIHKTGYTSVFDGQAGNDTLYADLSNWKSDVIIKNNKTILNDNNEVVTAATAIVNRNGKTSLTIKDVERLLISTGSGNDVIDNSANNTNDDISTGAGNDTINAGQGNDTIDAGAGNDTITLSTLGYTTSRISGGAGIDTLNLDYSATKESSGIQHTFHYKDTNGYTSSYGSYGSSVSKENIQKALADKRVFEHHYYNHHVVNNGGRSNYIHDDLTIENQNIKGTQADDLFIHKTGYTSVFDGQAGNDTLYADLSSSTDAITAKAGNITNTSGTLTATNIERLLLSTGSGNDVIDNSANNADDDISTGAGNDTITLSTLGSTTSRISGGTGIDTLNLDYSATKNSGGIQHTFHYKDTNGYTGSYGSYGSSVSKENIEKALTDKRVFEHYYYNYRSDTGGVNQIYDDLTIENQNIKGTQSDDLFIHKTGYTSVFDGQAGNDTLYADLSNWKSDVIIKNNKTILNDNNEVVTAATAIVNRNGKTSLTIKDVERLLLSTGSGNDVIDNSANNADDDISTGAGNDTITLSTLGSTTSRISGGTGIDTLNLDYSATKNSGGIQHTFHYKDTNGYTGSYGSYGSSVSKENIEKALTDKRVFEHYYHNYHSVGNSTYYNYIYNDLTIENQNIKGTQSDDLFIHKTGYTSVFDGQAGNDTLYADLSASTEAITAKAGNITNASGTLTATNIERLLISTGSGNDVIDNSANNADDDISTGAGNDTINAGQGNDTIDAGAGNDTIIYMSGSDTIDGGDGRDTINYSKVESGVNIDLNIQDSQYVSGGYTKLINIENVTGSSFEDKLTGNNANNILNGGKGADTMIGGLGNDTYYVDHSKDVIVEKAKEGTDTVYSRYSSFTLGENLENLILLDKAIRGTGNDLANTITGNNANNILNGGKGADTMIGGLGNDTYYVDHSKDVIVEKAKEGTDTVYSRYSSFTLGENLENLILLDKAIRGTGNDLANTITGNNANNILNGGKGADTMIGGLGNDTYYVDHSKDVIVEKAKEGTDTVYSRYSSFTLGENLENLILLDKAIRGTGNDLANTITGNNANNILNGGKGADTMIGGLGNDTYYVDHSKDVIVEKAKEGTDTVYSRYSSFTLGENLENLILLDKAIRGTGNDLANTITGNNANNILNGGKGADTMIGGLGNDTYYVDHSKDVIVEKAKEGTDTVYSRYSSFTLGENLENLILLDKAIRGTGNDLANTITGNNANNILNGGKGADTMIGGLGNDTYYVDHSKDVIVEKAKEGTDTVYSRYSSFTLGENLENLILLDKAIRGTGNDLANTITGNNANNILNGGKGADTMIGGLGNDTYYVDHSKDVIVEKAKEGTDTVYSRYSSFTLGENLENLILLDKAIRGTGNDLANTITGNNANNILNGGKGADTMIGGLGNDVFVFTSIEDSTVRLSDVISDFTSGFDRIDLSAIDADITKSGNQAFHTLLDSSQEFTSAGQLKFADNMLYANINDDNQADFAVQLNNLQNIGLQDIIL